jgi:cellulose synthase/poly-beta-1,6-N-acetylglucosamine synthase-like glycosyltransferase
MDPLKNTTMEATTATTVETETSTKLLDFENHLPLSFPDRRITDRRIFNRRDIETNNIKKITILIPCYNEEKGIGKVIDDVPIKKLAYLHYKTEIIVINNNSSDQTIEVALGKGAKIVTEKKQGKGNALKTGFRNISSDTDYVIR